MSVPAKVETISPTVSRRRVDHWFYIGMGLLVVVYNVAGFGPSLIIASGRLGPLSALVAGHAVVSFSFLLLFLTQATLVATRRTAVHRRVGTVAGPVVAVLMIVLSYVMTIEMGRRGHDLSGDLLRDEHHAQSLSTDALRQLSLPPRAISTGIALVGSFGILVGAGMWYRHNPEVHKRLMLLAVVGVLTGPPTGHLFGHWAVLGSLGPIVQLPLIIGFLSASGIHDRIAEGRVHPVSLWGAVLLLVWIGAWAVIGESRAWQGFAAWLIG